MGIKVWSIAGPRHSGRPRCSLRKQLPLKPPRLHHWEGGERGWRKGEGGEKTRETQEAWWCWEGGIVAGSAAPSRCPLLEGRRASEVPPWVSPTIRLVSPSAVPAQGSKGGGRGWRSLPWRQPRKWGPWLIRVISNTVLFQDHFTSKCRSGLSVWRHPQTKAPYRTLGGEVKWVGKRGSSPGGPESSLQGEKQRDRWRHLWHQGPLCERAIWDADGELTAGKQRSRAGRHRLRRVRGEKSGDLFLLFIWRLVTPPLDFEGP